MVGGQPILAIGDGDAGARFGSKPGYGMQVVECPHTKSPTLGAKFAVVGVTSPSLGDGSCSGPMVNVDRKLCNDSLV